jgi:hypothetical protein
VQIRDCPFNLRAFASVVSQCTEEKIHSDGDCIRNAAVSWQSAIATAHSLWRWELARLTGASEPITDGELFRRWTKTQSLKARVRGWLYVIRACGWHRSYEYWPRWARLSLQGSPRYLIYLAACSFLFDSAVANTSMDATLRQEIAESLLGLLPVPRANSNPHSPASLEGLASAIFCNYKTFLMGTRA